MKQKNQRFISRLFLLPLCLLVLGYCVYVPGIDCVLLLVVVAFPAPHAGGVCQHARSRTFLSGMAELVTGEILYGNAAELTSALRPHLAA